MSSTSDPRIYRPHVVRNREPILDVLRRVLPRMGGIDLSPILLFVIVQVLLMVVTRLAVTMTMFGV